MHISACKSKDFSDQSIKLSAASNNGLVPALNYVNTKSRAKSDGSCLKQDKVTVTHKKLLKIKNYLLKIYTACEINLLSFNAGKDFALRNSLFGVVKLSQNANLNKYKYSGYSTRFDVLRNFSLSDDSRIDKNVIIFGADMSSFVHTVNEKNDILILKKISW